MQNKSLYFLLVPILLILGVKCTPKEEVITSPTELKADFSMPLQDYVAGDTITFNNLSKNMTSSAWDFGDGSALSPTAKHAYRAAGTYTIKLVVMNAQGKQLETSKPITIIALPKNDVSMSIQSIDINRVPASNKLVNVYYTVKDSLQNIMFTSDVYADLYVTWLPRVISGNNAAYAIFKKNTVFYIIFKYKIDNSPSVTTKTYTIKPADYYGLRVIRENNPDYSTVRMDTPDFGLDVRIYYNT